MQLQKLFFHQNVEDSRPIIEMRSVERTRESARDPSITSGCESALKRARHHDTTNDTKHQFSRQTACGQLQKNP